MTGTNKPEKAMEQTFIRMTLFVIKFITHGVIPTQIYKWEALLSGGFLKPLMLVAN